MLENIHRRAGGEAVPSELDTFRSQVNDLQDEVASLKQQLDEARAENAELRSALEEQQRLYMKQQQQVATAAAGHSAASPPAADSTHSPAIPGTSSSSAGPAQVSTELPVGGTKRARIDAPAASSAGATPAQTLGVPTQSVPGSPALLSGAILAEPFGGMFSGQYSTLEGAPDGLLEWHPRMSEPLGGATPETMSGAAHAWDAQSWNPSAPLWPVERASSMNSWLGGMDDVGILSGDEDVKIGGGVFDFDWSTKQTARAPDGKAPLAPASASASPASHTHDAPAPLQAANTQLMCHSDRGSGAEFAGRASSGVHVRQSGGQLMLCLEGGACATAQTIEKLQIAFATSKTTSIPLAVIRQLLLDIANQQLRPPQKPRTAFVPTDQQGESGLLPARPAAVEYTELAGDLAVSSLRAAMDEPSFAELLAAAARTPAAQRARAGQPLVSTSDYTPERKATFIANIRAQLAPGAVLACLLPLPIAQERLGALLGSCKNAKAAMTVLEQQITTVVVHSSPSLAPAGGYKAAE